MSASMDVRQAAVSRLLAAIYVFTIGVAIAFAAAVTGMFIGLIDIFVGQLLIGERDLVESRLGGFEQLVTRSYRWYTGLLLYVAFGAGEFDWLP